MLTSEDIQKITSLGKRFSDTTIAMHGSIAKKAGLTGTDHKYLSILVEAKQMTAGELSKISGLTTGAVTGLIDRLEKRGLVTREFIKNDRRKVILIPNTKKIQNILGPSFDLLQSKVVTLVSTLTKKEMTVVSKYLHNAILLMEDVTNTLTKAKK